MKKRKFTIILTIVILMPLICGISIMQNRVSFADETNKSELGLDVDVSDVAGGYGARKGNNLPGYKVNLFTDSAEKLYAEAEAKAEQKEHSKTEKLFADKYTAGNKINAETQNAVAAAHLFEKQSNYNSYTYEETHNIEKTLMFIKYALLFISLSLIAAAASILIIKKNRKRHEYNNNSQN